MRSSTSSEIAMLDAAMQRQQLRSERYRVAIFECLLGLLMLVPFALLSWPGMIDEALRPLLAKGLLPFSLVIGAFLTYEIGVFLWLGRLISKDRLPPPGFAYLNTFVEVSMPTAGLLVGAAFIGGIPMLSGVVPFIYFLFLSLAALNLNPHLCRFAGLVAGVQFLVVSLTLLNLEPEAAGAESPLLAMLHSPHQYILKSVFLVLGGVIAGFVASQIKRQLFASLQTLQERDRAVSIFGQHVSPQVAELLLKQPVDAAGQERQVCVMFLDIRDFSRIASELSPGEVMNYLNTLFSFMIPVVNDHHGIINKFLGDGFMAVFGAPLDDSNPCQHAVRASHVILDKVAELNQSEAITTSRLGIGLHLGVAITGNVGGGERKEYTVIGDVVNLAARIEQATKTFAAQLLVSEEVFKNLGKVDAEDLGLVELKGQAKPARLYKLA
jgi:adenylate cyclase